MRFNFMLLVWVMGLMAVTRLASGDFLLGGLAAALSVACFVLHRKRVRQFKEFDQKRTFE